MSDDQPMRRRGRPRVTEEQRKRHTLTFRMRDDLREAIEEMARLDNRTISEQVEHYVNSGVYAQAAVIYQYQFNKLSPALIKYIKDRDRENGTRFDGLDLIFPSAIKDIEQASKNSESSTDKSTGLNSVKSDTCSEVCSFDLAQKLMDALHKGAIHAIEETFGLNIEEKLYNRTARLSLGGEARKSPRMPSIAELHGAEAMRKRLTLIREDIKQLRNLIESSASDPAVQETADQPRIRPHDPNGDFSITALRELVGRFRDRSPDFGPLRDARWPKQFKDLPADTRATLIGALREEAPLIYEALMVPVRSVPGALKQGTKPSRVDFQRIEIINALRRVQAVLLGDEQLDDGLDEDFGDMGERGAQRKR